MIPPDLSHQVYFSFFFQQNDCTPPTCGELSEYRKVLLRDVCKPVLGDWQSSYRQCRTDGIVLSRARIGHTHREFDKYNHEDPF